MSIYEPCTSVVFCSPRHDLTQLSVSRVTVLHHSWPVTIECARRSWTETNTALQRIASYSNMAISKEPYPVGFFSLHIQTVGNSQPRPNMERSVPWKSDEQSSRYSFCILLLKLVWEFPEVCARMHEPNINDITAFSHKQPSPFFHNENDKLDWHKLTMECMNRPVFIITKIQLAQSVPWRAAVPHSILISLLKHTLHVNCQI